MDEYISDFFVETLPYRPGVGLMLLNRDNHVFVGKRLDTRSDAWQMPQGGIDEGEEASVAALREMHEEIGTDKASILAESQDWHYYDLPVYLIPKLWNGQYRGQKQKWFLLRFLGEDTDINIHTADPEFGEWQWVPMNELPDIIVPFKRDLYVKIVNEFKIFL
ncbi:MAG: pyrophosphohydrolase [Rickettsiales bacterium]|jgi:putative (di)nucleoside polyphosphate hydrolase|nr:pyrophosphohydrolase [Rickettsiales bacterium]